MNHKTLIYLTLGVSMMGIIAVQTSCNTEAKASDSPVVPQEKITGCVFNSLFGEESVDSFFVYKTPRAVESSLDEALVWMTKAQHTDGGWGAGTHNRQDIMDPHAVNPDPATTSMVGMALLRTGNTLDKGEYSTSLRKATEWLLTTIENVPEGQATITTEAGTQIQTKLGQNIDAVLSMQFLSNLLDHVEDDPAMKERVMNCLNVCVTKVQGVQNPDGSVSGAGWAGVLQSSFANNALESARDKGAAVDTAVLNRSREYQEGNYDPATGEINAKDGAGVMLYSVSGSARASALKARKVKKDVERAVERGELTEEEADNISPTSLEKIGYDKEEAMKSTTSYNVYQSAKSAAQRDDITSGFGNNGGEEFLSFLQTGESMIINHDPEWKKWYDNTSGKMIAIQNDNGSWNGHHCITSPVFCTATCILILSVNNDIEELSAVGAQ